MVYINGRKLGGEPRSEGKSVCQQRFLLVRLWRKSAVSLTTLKRLCSCVSYSSNKYFPTAEYNFWRQHFQVVGFSFKLCESDNQTFCFHVMQNFVFEPTLKQSRVLITMLLPLQYKMRLLVTPLKNQYLITAFCTSV